MEIYLVVAYRWGDNNILKEYDTFENNTMIKHSYVLGIFENLKVAIENSQSERSNRGGKYECIVYKMKLNSCHKSIVYSTFDDYEKYI